MQSSKNSNYDSIVPLILEENYLVQPTNTSNNLANNLRFEDGEKNLENLFPLNAKFHLLPYP